MYIVGKPASGAWLGKEGKIAYHQDVWKFIEPKAGMLFFVYDDKSFYRFHGSEWEKCT